MANTFAVSRAHLIYGVCLPVAVVIGYLLAEPMESGSVAVVVLVLAILSIPLFMRWHHPLLIFSCNAVILPYFLPGRPELWIVMTAVSLFFSAMNRSLGSNLQFFKAPSVSYSLIFIGAVVMITAWMTGGLGLAILGSSSIGGKKYFGILAAIGLYFALATPVTSPNRVKICVALFFLSALLPLISYAAAFGGRPFYFLVEFFPIEGTVQEGNAGTVAGQEVISRFGTLAGPALGLFWFMLAMYGARGVLDLKKPWRLALVLLAMAGSAWGGFRSGLIIMGMVYVALFYMEGLFRTRYVLAALLVLVLGGAFLVTQARNLPTAVQRSLSFIPGIDLDPFVRFDAEGSTTWRVLIWKRMFPQIPKYLLKGKGYAMNPEELEQLQSTQGDAPVLSQEGAVLAGDYHSGPLSVVITFGIFGVIAFAWFLSASVKVLYRNYLYGDPAFANINRFLFTFFVVKIVFFLTIFGGFHSDMAVFAGLIGLSVSLNGGVRHAPEPLPEPAMDELLSAEV
jgi:hypothetical protein